MSGFAGTLRTRVTWLRPTEARNALGADGEDWTVIDVAAAAIVPAATGAAVAGDAAAAMPVWRVTARPFPVRVGDRLEWAAATIDVREVQTDPRLVEHARAQLPDGIAVEAVEHGARLSGRRLIRRHADDPRLRGLASIVGRLPR